MKNFEQEQSSTKQVPTDKYILHHYEQAISFDAKLACNILARRENSFPSLKPTTTSSSTFPLCDDEPNHTFTYSGQNFVLLSTDTYLLGIRFVNQKTISIKNWVNWTQQVHDMRKLYINFLTVTTYKLACSWHAGSLLCFEFSGYQDYMLAFAVLATNQIFEYLMSHHLSLGCII